MLKVPGLCCCCKNKVRAGDREVTQGLHATLHVHHYKHGLS